MGVATRLSVMMFLQFFTWGAWFATLGQCLGENGLKDVIGGAYQSAPIAAMLAPLFLGLIADRFFPSQIVLGLLMLVGGGILLVVPGYSTPERSGVLVWLFIAHMLCYMPTLGLSNTIAFSNLDDQNEFPKIRVWGTIGWIVAGLTVGFLGWSAKFEMFQLAGGCAILLGIFSFFLPHTPPPAAGKSTDIRTLLMVDAFSMLKNIPFLVFIVCSTLICIPLAYYYALTSNLLGQLGFAAPAATMTLGQMSEVFFMILIPVFFRRLGVKWMILIGMAAWVVRYLLFAFGTPPQTVAMILLAVLLHGVCYDFFFVTGFMYTDQKAPKEVRGQAQSLLVFFTQGVGMFFGFWIAGARFGSTVGKYAQASLDAKVISAESTLANLANTPAAADGQEEVAQEAVQALAAAVGQAKEALVGANPDAINTATEALNKAVGAVSETPSFGRSLAQMFSVSLPDGIDTALLQDVLGQWKEFWIVPAGMAAVIFVIFLVAFHEKPEVEQAATEQLDETPS